MPAVACLYQTKDAVWFLAESSSRQPSVATTFRNAASTEVHWHSPVPSFPHPVRLDGSGSPWASPVCFRTPRYRGACAGQEPTWALVGAVVTRHLPLIWCDFVSHPPRRNVGRGRARNRCRNSLLESPLPASRWLRVLVPGHRLQRPELLRAARLLPGRAGALREAEARAAGGDRRGGLVAPVRGAERAVRGAAPGQDRREGDQPLRRRG